MLRFRKDPARLILVGIAWMTAFAKGLAAAEPEDRPRLIRADPNDRIPGQYIVILDDDTLPGDSVPTVADDLLATHGGRPRVYLQNAVRGFSASLTEDQAARLSRDPRVRLVEENARAYLSSEQALPPDDSLWHLDRVDQRTAVGPGDDKYRYCETGSNAIVYVLDTGINKRHQEFLLPNGQSRVLNGVKFASDHHVWPGEADDYGTYPCGGWTDNYGGGHGTSVGSLIAGKTLGIAKAARLVPLRVFPCSGPVATVEHLCWALDWIKSPSNPTRNHRPALVNISLRVATNQPLVSALESVINGLVLTVAGWSGIPVIASANNQNTSQACSTPARMAYRNTAFASPGRVISAGGTNAGMRGGNASRVWTARETRVAPAAKWTSPPTTGRSSTSGRRRMPSSPHTSAVRRAGGRTPKCVRARPSLPPSSPEWSPGCSRRARASHHPRSGASCRRTRRS